MKDFSRSPAHARRVARRLRIRSSGGGAFRLAALAQRPGSGVTRARFVSLRSLNDRGVPLCLLSSGEGGFDWSRLVKGSVAEHGVEDVGAASSQCDEGLVVALALSDLAVVVGARFGVA